jgi:hypothetical protein
MAEKKVSIKHLQIDKNQSTMLAVIAVAVVVVVFSLFATKSMITKAFYQKRALHARQDVAATLKSNYTAAQTLFTQYKNFANQDPNILGGTVGGSTNLDGQNAVVVLDALPSTYDAPALATSVEKIMSGRNITINSLTITDDPTTNSDTPQTTPKPKSITFSFEGTTNFAGGAQLLQDFERSIRPFDINTLEISGTDTQLKLSVGMTTYFQPAKSLNLQATKEVK